MQRLFPARASIEKRSDVGVASCLCIFAKSRYSSSLKLASMAKDWQFCYFAVQVVCWYSVLVRALP